MRTWLEIQSIDLAKLPQRYKYLLAVFMIGYTNEYVEMPNMLTRAHNHPLNGTKYKSSYGNALKCLDKHRSAGMVDRKDNPVRFKIRENKQVKKKIAHVLNNYYGIELSPDEF